MNDCYQILGVSHEATASEIKRAYRKKAKLLHPDMKEGDAAAFRELTAAYRTLIDLKSRQIFDSSFAFRNFYGSQKKDSSFDYRAWLSARTDDESRAKLIVLDLMHCREDDAVKEFKRMNMTSPSFRLSRWFTREDFMDYGFILAEELILRGEYYDAVIILDQVIRMEYSYSYFKLFFPEVLSLARKVLMENIEGFLNDELAIDCYEKALDLRFGNADDALFLKKMSGCYERIGDSSTAAVCRQEAERLLKLHGE